MKCLGSCTGQCDNGCTNTASQTSYTSLGTGVIKDGLITNEYILLLQQNIVRELQRRNITYIPINTDIVDDYKIEPIHFWNIHDNCVKAGYVTSIPDSIYSATRVTTYVNYVKQLYNQILVD